MSELIVAIDGGIATLTLDAPDRRNALTEDLCGEIGTAFDRLEADDGVGAVIITGTPPAFCAGAELRHLTDADEAGLRRIYEGFLRVSRSPLPTLAAVNGAAVGAGVNLALACDVRIAAESARFVPRFLELGIHPGGGHTWMLQRILGPQGTLATAVFADELDGAEAARVGLAWRCVSDDQLMEEATRLAAGAAGAPREVALRVKEEAMGMGDVATHAEAVDRELEAQLWSLGLPHFADRLAALRDRLRR